MPRLSLSRLAVTAMLGVLTGVAGYVAYRMVRSELAAGVYRSKLERLAGDYESLRATYNEAIRKTAVTELVVKDGRLCVVVRNAAGERESIDTPFDPSREIYVDYTLVDGRLLIRRVFDDRTPPALGLLIDAKLAAVDWNAPGAAHGKAVYRTLGEGRWTIHVTGNGSLALARADDGEAAALVHAPPVKDYARAVVDADATVGDIGLADVVRGIVGP